MNTRPVVIHVPAGLHDRLMHGPEPETAQQLALQAFRIGFEAMFAPKRPALPAVTVPVPAVVEPTPSAEPAVAPAVEPVAAEPPALTRREIAVVRGYGSAGQSPAAVARLTGLPVTLVRKVMRR